MMGGDHGHDQLDSVASGSAHYLPGMWALPLITFSGHGTFSLPPKLRLAERKSNNQKIYVNILPQRNSDRR